MAKISPQTIKELREKTNAGMLDCKAALEECDGDLERAVDWLRKKGLAKAAKKAGRVAAEGLIGVALAPAKGVLVEVNSETDFVPRNEHFQGLVKMIAQAALKIGPSVDAILAAHAGAATIGDAITSAIATIGENMSLRRAAVLSAKEGVVASYVHNQISEGLGKIGVLVALESSGKADELSVLGRLLAQHVSWSNPQALDAAGLDPSVVAREKDILAEKFRAQGKPAHVIEKIVESGLKTFYKEVALLDQPYIREPDKSVAQFLKESESKVGAPIRIGGYVRFALGEGIEKQESDFAAEVAAAASRP
jgi:elongation factor Ts